MIEVKRQRLNEDVFMLDYYASIDDFWGISKGGLKGLRNQEQVPGEVR